MNQFRIVILLLTIIVMAGVTVGAADGSPGNYTPAQQAEFDRAAREYTEFRVETIEEYFRMKEYRQGLLEDGEIVHSFETKEGDDCLCIDVYSQGSLKAAGISPEDLTLAPITPPKRSSDPVEKQPHAPGVIEADGLRLDGSRDKDGRIRRCPELSFPRIIPSMEDLCRFRKFEDRFSKYPPAYLFENKGNTPADPVLRSNESSGKPATTGIEQRTGRPGTAPMSVTHKYAYVKRTANNIGEGGDFNLWSPLTENNDEFSLCQMWCSRGYGNDLQTVELGWQVYHTLYGGNTARLFIFFTNNNYSQGGDNKGCYNLDCTGFVQTDSSITLGNGWSTYSSAGGNQYYATLETYRDQATGHWWIRYGGNSGIWVGYYPNSLFDIAGLKNMSDTVEFGGEIVDDGINGNTKTDMGSGKFPSRGFGYAAWVSNLHFWTDAALNPATGMTEYRTDSTLYDVDYQSTTSDGWNNYFYFGGPGANETDAELELYYENHENIDCFSAGDIFDGHYRISNGTSSAANVDLFIVLEYYGNYAFWPAWTSAINKQLVTVPASGVLDNSFLQFFWPGEVGTISGLKFYGVMMEPNTYNRIGDVKILNLCALGSGDISFQLTWTYGGGGEGPDLDLHVTNPNGYHIYYGNKTSPDGGSLDADDLGACGDGDGGGPENIFWQNGRAPSGRYNYAVNWYGACGSYTSASFTLRVRVNGNLVDTKTGTISGGTQEFSYIY